MMNEEEAFNLYQSVTLEEVKEVMFLFKKEKSMGLDGWIVELFTHFFDLVGEDLLAMVKESKILGFILGGLNATFPTLIPKENILSSFDDFRPISFCNLCYKIISKIISNRLKPLLSKDLSLEQMGFLKGRRIQDAIGTTHERLHSIKKKKPEIPSIKIGFKESI